MAVTKRLISTQVPSPMHKAIKAAVQQDGINIAEYTRRLFTVDLQNRGFWPPRPEKKVEENDNPDRVH